MVDEGRESAKLKKAYRILCLEKLKLESWHMGVGSFSFTKERALEIVRYGAWTWSLDDSYSSTHVNRIEQDRNTIIQFENFSFRTIGIWISSKPAQEKLFLKLLDLNLSGGCSNPKSDKLHVSSFQTLKMFL